MLDVGIARWDGYDPPMRVGIVVALMGFVALGVACGSERTPNTEDDAGPVGTGTIAPEASMPVEAGELDASDAAVAVDAADAAIPPGWCATGPQATAPKQFLKYQEVSGSVCIPEDCPNNPRHISYTTNIVDRAEYVRTPPNRIQGCKLSVLLSAWCCPQGCTQTSEAECPAITGVPLSQGYSCFEQADGSVPVPTPATNCVNLRQLGGTKGRLWCCDEGKPY